MNGVLEQAGDRWRLRFERRLGSPPEMVWQAITEPEHLERWFPFKIVGEWTTVGSTLRFEHDGDPFDGRVLACDPGSLLEFRWGDDTIRLEIERDGDGSKLTLLDTFDELGKAARDAAGWHECLDWLAHDLDEAAPVQRWAELHPRYVEALGAEASTIGPPEGVTAD
jgi:uncharacterized protein YndB with AHSA1/START domain